MPRVLVVDDDLGTLETCEVILRGTGLEVETAPCGRAALAALDRMPCELLLTDLKLPDIDGLEVLAGLRRRALAIPAVVMTGYPSVETAAQAMRLGAVEYLVKPVFDDDIRAAVWRALRQGAAGEHAQSDIRAAAAPDRASGEAAAGWVNRIEDGAPMPDGLTRWAQAMTAAIHAAEDVTTIEAWAELVRPYVAPATLRGWCRAADLSAKGSLDLARVLRAVQCARRAGAAVRHFLSALDPRTVERLLRTARIGDCSATPSLEEVLDNQMFVRDRLAVETLRRLLVQSVQTPASR